MSERKARSVKGYGTKIEFKHSGWEVFGKVYNVNGRGAREALDVTHFESPAPGENQWGGSEYVPSAPADAGTIDLELVLDPDSVPPWNGDPEPIVITLPTAKGYSNGTIWSGDGFLTDEGAAIEVKGFITQSATVQLTGVWSAKKAE
jgi:hypothetical protein